MEEPLKEEDGEEKPTGIEKNEEDETVALPVGTNRKEKRKAIKKLKRKQMRKEIAAKEREEEQARLNDPEEQKRALLMEQEEAERVERERKLFEERERAWIETMEKKMKKAAEEEQRKLLEDTHKQQQEKETELNEDGEWEYVEEGPAEIIWQGNEIIFKKKKVRVPKKDSSHQNKREDADKPTSNPLPPESEVFADYTNSSAASARQVLESVAQQVPNFGTEQDKAHCPFHLKTGTCRFGQRCSRVHFYPDKSSTLLMKNMYTGPGLVWEQDEGLEYTDEEVEHSFEEFYEDVHTEFLKFGEIVNFKVCKNGSFHLRGNVYVHYKSMDSAVLAYNSINGRYFAGKQIRCEFVNVTRWKVAICGEYMKSGFKTCSHGSACNFIHCFRNPGGDYEWADADKPPPKYWVKKMAALFGYSDEHEKLMEQQASDLKSSSKIQKADSHRYHSRRSRSREIGEFNSNSSGRRKRGDERKWSRTRDGEICEQTTNLKDKHKGKGRTSDSDTVREWSDREEDRRKHHTRHRKSSINWNDGDERRSHEGYFDVDSDVARGYSKNRHQHHREHSTTRNNGDERSYEGYSDVDSNVARGYSEKRHQHHRKHSTTRNEGDERSHEHYSDVDSDAALGCSKKRYHCCRKHSTTRNEGDERRGCEGYSDVDLDATPGHSKKRHHHHRKHSTARNEGDERSHEGYSDVDSDATPGDRKKHHQPCRKCSINRKEDDERRNEDGYSDVDSDAVTGDRKKRPSGEGRSSRKRQRNNDEAGSGDWSDRDGDKKWHRKSRSSRNRSRDYGYSTSDTESGTCSFDRDGESSRKISKHRRSGLRDDYEDYENKSEVNRDRSKEEKDRREHRHETRKSSKHEKKLESDDDQDDNNVH
ncbi:zinc finger CCCH domain-containing protein 5 isoform X2 [Neltuma alba]|uniref:zinc finger CCCH domain-containing protein 5 isoform X2 n=1 Tax=Neltuma alba TaxID=207710 RepID=UPI0010A4882B|nr:zinc finger CCCH domain-containing protein 5-like isoform X2 [Prosopis alba]